MEVLVYLIPIALGMGAIGLGAFLWTLKSGQYDDLDGAAQRILMEDDDRPLPDPERAQSEADGPDDVHKS
tara:strand:- start:1093 stop:1302 length:210 start_codon:yes stop_codon:yes gene_type:complete